MTDAAFEVQSLFYQGAYQGAIDLASKSGARQQQLYAARSYVALHDGAAATRLLSSLPDTDVAAQAIRQLAAFVDAHGRGDSAASDEASAELSSLLDDAVQGDEDGQVVRVAAATAMHLEGDSLSALETLGVGSADSTEIECIALGVHILLEINRPDLAQKEYEAARQWADDSLLIQLIEAWIGISAGGKQAERAFYMYDELAVNSAHANTRNAASILVGKAVAQATQREYAKAKAALEEAESLDPDNVDVIANQAVLAFYGSRATDLDPSRPYLDRLAKIAPQHPLLDLQEKETSFEAAVANLAITTES